MKSFSFKPLWCDESSLSLRYAKHIFRNSSSRDGRDDISVQAVIGWPELVSALTLWPDMMKAEMAPVSFYSNLMLNWRPEFLRQVVLSECGFNDISQSSSLSSDDDFPNYSSQPASIWNFRE